jgi:predicted ArsR family transcriptional regulator
MTEHITREAILAFLKPSKSHQARHIAAVFGCNTTPMRQVLVEMEQEGLIESQEYNGTKLYSCLKQSAADRQMKPLTISREMKAAQERCKELRVYPSRFCE